MQHFSCLLIYLFYYFYFIFLRDVFIWPYHGACGILFPDEGSNLHPLQWKRRVLATGHQGSTQVFILIMTITESLTSWGKSEPFGNLQAFPFQHATFLANIRIMMNVKSMQLWQRQLSGCENTGEEITRSRMQHWVSHHYCYLALDVLQPLIRFSYASSENISSIRRCKVFWKALKTTKNYTSPSVN